MSKFKKGKIIRGTVTGIETYGVFVSCDDYYSGLIHISEISHNFVKNVNDFVKIGDIINVEILDVDEELCQLNLSIKNIEYKKKNIIKRRKIKETSQGFNSLAYWLPIWIEENIKSKKNIENSIDK
jgi:general stress protein 13